MVSGVRALGDLWKEGLPYFGNKANMLSQILGWGGNVLPGFCVTFDLSQEYDSQLKCFSAQIEQAYRSLVRESVSRQVIVRSSADLEDSKVALFPGIFSSVTGVLTLPQLYMAIRKCYDSAWSPIVSYYAQANKAQYKIRYFTVLIQEELDAKYAGLATTRIPIEGYKEDAMLASLTRGNNHDLVKGMAPGNTYSFYLNQNGIQIRKIAGDIPMNPTEPEDILHALYLVLVELRKKFSRELEIEWGFADGKVYVFQVRFVLEAIPADDRKIESFCGDEEQGFKYQAMRYFQKEGLFPRKTIFFPNEISAEEASQILRTQELDPPVTVRFSKKGELGLPRAFLPCMESAVDYVRDTKQADWSVIIYSSLTVRKSYEWYVDQDMAILEYVPGMWESDSALTADTAMLTRDRACFWLVRQERIARYEDETGSHTSIVLPTSQTQMQRELLQRIPTLCKLRKIFSKDLPLNFHFVSDGEQDFFLNCRRSHHISWKNRYGGSVQVIENMVDCARWDGKSAILFRPKIRRGEELLLFQFIPFLKSLSVPVFVEFGILSHPSIMLRELGIPVVPYFFHHDYYELPLEEMK